MTDHIEIEDAILIFTSHAPSLAQLAAFDDLRAFAVSLATRILIFAPPSRERDRAITELDRSLQAANSAIARHGLNPILDQTPAGQAAWARLKHREREASEALEDEDDEGGSLSDYLCPESIREHEAHQARVQDLADSELLAGLQEAISDAEREMIESAIEGDMP